MYRHVEVFLVLLLAGLAFSDAARVNKGLGDPYLKVAAKVVNGELGVDEHILKLAGGSIQQILDWVPHNTKLSIKIANFTIEEPLRINKPVHITSEDKLMRSGCRPIQITSRGVTIRGIHVVGCTRSVIQVSNAKNILLKDISCHKSSTQQAGGCISVYKSSVRIENLKGVENVSSGPGGVVYASESSIQLSKCTFDRNSALVGGAVATQGGDIGIMSSSFRGNTAVRKGGAISGQGTKLYALESKFTSNTAQQDNGGAISYKGGLIVFTRTSLENNRAQTSGGGLHGTGNIEMNTCNFKGNNAVTENGGAAFLQSVTAKIFWSVFEDNKAEKFGGGIMAFGQIRIYRTKLIGNKADKNTGGAAYLWAPSDSITVQDTEVESNTAQVHSGGLYIKGVSTIKNGTFNDNQAATGVGGGLRASGGLLTVSESKFTSNKAGTYGAGIHTLGETVVSSTTFSTNTADREGGGIYCQGTLDVSSSIFNGNTAVAYGGGIYATATAEVSSSIFLGNTVAKHNGGGIYAKGPKLTVGSTTFAQNNAKAFGGGLCAIVSYVTKTTEMTVSSSMFQQNGAGGFGGGVFTKGDSMAVDGSMFVDNTANRGGGITSKSHTSSISSSGNMFINSPVDPPLLNQQGLTSTTI